MTIANHYFDLDKQFDRYILNLMTIICSAKLNRVVSVDELPNLYETNEVCRREMDYIING